jgi:Undecaprenyl-phosphate galactose phosphotransferase WbaP
MASKPALAFPAPLSSPAVSTTSPWLTSAWLLFGDVLALSTVYWLAVFGWYTLTHGYSLSFYLDSFSVLILYLLTFLAYGLYPGVLLHPAEELKRVSLGVSTVFVASASVLFISRTAESYSRSVFIITWAVGAPVVLLVRYMVRRIGSRRPWWGQSAIVLGSSESAQRLIRSLKGNRAGVRVVGILADEYVSSWPSDLPPILGFCGHASGAELGSVANYIIVAVSNKTPLQLRQAIHNSCKGFRHILLVPELMGLCSLGIGARDIGGEVGFEVPQRLFHSGAIFAKRLMDIALSALILLSLLPIFILTSLLIRLDSKGPVFFGHLRYGKDGEIFRAWKFRTMVTNAEQVLREHIEAHPEDYVAWQRDHKLRKDPRITNIGRWLRRYSLDELPQLWNVLTGDMSLVGPRPIVDAEISKYGDGYDLYTRVPPGITGLWQVSGRNNTTYQARVAFDEYYVRNWSIWLDAYILARTVKVVVTAEGAY